METVYWGDVKQLLRRRWKRGAIFGASIALVALLFGASFPPRYRAEATFHQPLLPGEGEAVSLMSSRLLLSKVGQELGCQAVVAAPLRQIVAGLAIECGLLPKEEAFVWRDVTYKGNEKKEYRLSIDTEKRFTFGDFSAPFGEPLHFPEGTLTLVAAPQGEYRVTLLPQEEMLTRLERSLHIEKEAKDPTLVTLSFTASNRRLSRVFLDRLMERYQDYLRTEEERIALAQKEYLEEALEKGDKEIAGLRIEQGRLEASLEAIEEEQRSLQSKSVPQNSPLAAQMRASLDVEQALVEGNVPHVRVLKKLMAISLPFQAGTVSGARRVLSHEKTLPDLEKALSALIDGEVERLQQERNGAIDIRLAHLSREKETVVSQLTEVHKEMDALVTTRLGVAKAVESNGATQHLKQVESKPIDAAHGSPKPQKRYLFLLALLVGGGAAATIYAYEVRRGITRGLPLSLESLSKLGRHVLGNIDLQCCPTTLYEASETLLEVLRQGLQGTHTSVGVIGPKSLGLAQIIAELTALEGKSVLLFDLSFREGAQQPGLWQFIHNEIVNCPIVHKGHYDLIAMGMSTPYGRELLQKKELRAFIAEQKERYDTLVFYSPASPKTAEAKTMMEFADRLIIALEEESLQEIHDYLRWEDRGNAVSFLATENSL